MVYQRVPKSSSWNPPSQEKSSQFAPRPFAVQAQQDSHRPPAQQEIENEAFNQNKLEAFGLQLKEKSGTITPVEQEKLGVLQAKMDDFWAQRLERASRFGHNFANIPVHAPGQQVSAPVQPRLAIQPYRADIPVQSLQPAISSKLVEDHATQAKGNTAGDRPNSSAEQRPNKTGMPDALKAGVESLSGYSLDDVRVHYNSPKPAQLKALAYTQGTEIHVAPGQEKHLPHEAWHVVQQAQGRVKPRMQMKDGVSINNDEELEHEAEVKGNSVSDSDRVGEGLRKDAVRFSYAPKPDMYQNRVDSLPSSRIATVQRKVGRADGTADMSADQIQEWLTNQGLWQGISDRVLDVIEKMMQSEHQWIYGGFFPYLLVRDAKALIDTHYRQGLIHGDLIGVKNEADFHVDPGDGGSLRADMLAVAQDVCEKMTAANTIHGAPKGRVYLRPQGAAIIKIVSQMLGEALGQRELIEQAHRSIQWRKFKEAALDKIPVYTRPKLSKEVLDKSVVPEHSDYMKSLVGVSGVDIKPLLRGAKSLEEFTQNMLEESQMGRDRLQKYLETVESGNVSVSMDIYISQDRLPNVISLLQKQG